MTVAILNPSTSKNPCIIDFLNFSLTASQKSYWNNYAQNKNYNEITIFILMDLHYLAGMKLLGLEIMQWHLKRIK